MFGYNAQAGALQDLLLAMTEQAISNAHTRGADVTSHGYAALTSSTKRTHQPWQLLWWEAEVPYLLGELAGALGPEGRQVLAVAAGATLMGGAAEAAELDMVRDQGQ